LELTDFSNGHKIDEELSGREQTKY
jgi:hypothetical protein